MHAASTWLYAVGDVGVLRRDGVERALPQIAGEREHVGLVDERDVLALTGRRQLERVPHAAFDAHPCVDRALRRHLVRRPPPQRAALADIRAFGVLADDHERVRPVVSGRGAGERTLVDVQVELEAHLEQQAALDHAGRHVGRADRAEQDRIERRAARRASRPRGSRRRAGSGHPRDRTRWSRCRHRRHGPL